MVELLKSSGCESVTLVGRRRLNEVPESTCVLSEFEKNGKLKQVIMDMDKIGEEAALFLGHNAAFSCLGSLSKYLFVISLTDFSVSGTTRKDAGSAVLFSDPIAIEILSYVTRKLFERLTTTTSLHSRGLRSRRV